MIIIQSIKLRNDTPDSTLINSMATSSDANSCQCLVCGACVSCVLFIFLVGVTLSVSLGFALTNTQNA